MESVAGKKHYNNKLQNASNSNAISNANGKVNSLKSS